MHYLVSFMLARFIIPFFSILKKNLNLAYIFVTFNKEIRMILQT